MPDADDFDVEYFRNLLKGNSPKAGAGAAGRAAGGRDDEDGSATKPTARDEATSRRARRSKPAAGSEEHRNG